MFNLTQQEKQVLLFMAGVFLLGAGIDYASKKNSRINTLVCFNQNIGKININKADKDTLMSVSGIGDKLAQRILEYRDLNEKFGSIEELKKIKGLNPYRFDKVKDSLYVDKDLKRP
jgi:competence ComEA-like helix-hairpin-helix protein